MLSLKTSLPFFFLVALATLSACSRQEASESPITVSTGEIERVQPQQPMLSSGIDLQFVKAEISPGDDFYRYVNGLWLDNTEIPADKSNYGGFTVLADEAEENLRSIIET